MGFLLTIQINSFMYTLSDIDKEHKDLFSRCDSITENIGKVSESESISAISELLDTIRRHFAHEESMMKDLIHFDYDGHKETHASFIRMSAELYNTMLLDTTFIPDVARILKNWLSVHIEIETLLFSRSYSQNK